MKYIFKKTWNKESYSISLWSIRNDSDIFIKNVMKTLIIILSLVVMLGLSILGLFFKGNIINNETLIMAFVGLVEVLIIGFIFNKVFYRFIKL